MNSPQQEQFDQYCLVELMGRQRLAGKVSERVIAGQGFLQVDVPETTRNPKFTRLIAPGSIYALNPIDEKTALWYAENIQAKPIDSWDISEFMKKVEIQKQLKAGEKDALRDQQPIRDEDIPEHGGDVETEEEEEDEREDEREF